MHAISLGSKWPGARTRHHRTWTMLFMPWNRSGRGCVLFQVCQITYGPSCAGIVRDFGLHRNKALCLKSCVGGSTLWMNSAAGARWEMPTHGDIPSW